MKRNKFQFVLVIICIILSACQKSTKVEEEFYPNGYLKSSAEVMNGMRNGITKNYDEQGRLVSSAEFVNDVYEGWMINYNPENGKVTAKALYKNNNQHGPATLYYTDGSLYREMFYKDGRLDSIVKTYWPDGKLQAENYFKMGSPALGLKEYDKKGNLIKQPQIVIEEINQLALLDKVILKIYLSDGTKKVEFYEGSLLDGKFLNPIYSNMAEENGVCKMEFFVMRRKTLMRKLNIITKSRTELGNTLILQAGYNLAVTN